ncbi:hypothetical protein [Vreelandella venusta]|uniref:Uncharacterized protein n=1 Tax=Vreelandella venusta TaxID=44935 RepID=A0AAQ0CJ86_9GAMM|nr:hypothetical protein [Halomonas venusta]QRL05171.1 hypothetical protein JDS37_09660 [Halomonas venusta]GEK50942.1 hypothetical protein HVE01_16630 [Halomonas venusta]
MDTAYCTQDQTKYYVANFAQLSESEIGGKRRHLICVECGWPAYFKRAATSGQGACFGARPHATTCSLGTPQSKKGLGSDEVQDILRNPMNHIRIDINYGAHEKINGDPTDIDKTNTRGGRFTGEGPRGPSPMQRRLRPLLKALISSEQFRQSNVTVELPRHTALPANQFFVNFDSVTESYANLFRGYWGLVFDTGMTSDGSLWLNTGKYDDLSILISPDKYESFKRKFDFQFDRDLEGMHMLVFGKLRQARTGKLIVDVEELDFCTLCDD